MPPPLSVTFAAGAAGPWRIERIEAVLGEALPAAARLTMQEGASVPAPPDAVWALRGTTSNPRYTTRAELDALAAVQQGLGRRQATRAALIPIRKTEA
ncbi:hypothetical protein [Plastoroseomonas hellenica]|nr:hypothetical protein [Plastoroseomonas hellenica]